LIHLRYASRIRTADIYPVELLIISTETPNTPETEMSARVMEIDKDGDLLGEWPNTGFDQTFSEIMEDPTPLLDPDVLSEEMMLRLPPKSSAAIAPR
ncbi:MAG: hypothetical protein OXC95_13805, partial [Dehalococcoidia bacterium]|nr:hypothetical protein [Dehalococcoidia bacterium]